MCRSSMGALGLSIERVIFRADCSLWLEKGGGGGRFSVTPPFRRTRKTNKKELASRHAISVVLTNSNRCWLVLAMRAGHVITQAATRKRGGGGLQKWNNNNYNSRSRVSSSANRHQPNQCSGNIRVASKIDFVLIFFHEFSSPGNWRLSPCKTYPRWWQLAIYSRLLQ